MVVFFATWTIGAGLTHLPVVVSAAMTAVAVVASVGDCPAWDAAKRDIFNKNLSVAALGLLLAVTIVDTFDLDGTEATDANVTGILVVVVVCAAVITGGVLFECRSR